MKICNTCKIAKPIEEFHLCRTKLDGHSYKCKLCTQAYDKIHQKEYYQRTREYQLLSKRKYKGIHWKINEDIKAGKLKRGICKICKQENSEAHHRDYTQPLFITWLCKKHHRIWHIKVKNSIKN